MDIVCRIDKDGFFVGDVLLENGEAMDADCVAVQPVGIHSPRWNGSEWIESASPDVLSSVKFGNQNSVVLEEVLALEQSVDSSRIRRECAAGFAAMLAGLPLSDDEKWAIDRVASVHAEIKTLQASLIR